MPKRGEGRTANDRFVQGYLQSSRTLSLGLFYILPLVALYEWGLLVSGSRWRNGADVLVKGLFELFGPHGLPVLNVTFLLACASAMVLILRRRVPVGVYYFPLLAEAALYGLTLGPIVDVLRSGVLNGVAAPLAQASRADQSPMTIDLLLSVGAGVYEEVFFRLLILSWTYLVLARWLGLGPAVAVAGAIGVSALAFSTFHYLGPSAEPLELSSFAFRAVAGAILGLLFAVRGLAVAVYTHTFYDVFFYLGL